VRWIDRVSQLAVAGAERRGFRPLGPVAERHGSWELSLQKEPMSGDLNRFVFLAITPGAGAWTLEFRAGADDGSRFVRRTVGQCRTTPDELARIDQELQRILLRAIEIANSLVAIDLTGSYLPSRARGGRSA